MVRSLVILLLFLTSNCYAAKTYITVSDVQVFDKPNGQLVATWPSRTLFTSGSETPEWVRVTGHFPEGHWQPMSPDLFVLNGQNIKQKSIEHKNAPKTIVYTKLEGKANPARAYRLLRPTIYYETRAEAELAFAKRQLAERQEIITQPTSDEETPSTKERVQESKPDSESHTEQSTRQQKVLYTERGAEETEPAKVWAKGSNFTSNFETEKVVKATGYFPEGKWQKLPKSRWMVKPIQVQNRTKPTPYKRTKQTHRFAVIDKTEFHVTLYEVTNGEKTKILRAPVALGYDRCLSEAKGGKCYYTPQGEYEIEFGLFDPDGINWCIPKKMEAEFKEQLARGERCWRGIMGNHALHFGNSLFLHGTSNPNSIGSRSTHGCVRLRNNDIAMIYRLLAPGDKVLISETPEEFDLIVMAEQRSLKQGEINAPGSKKKQPKITITELPVTDIQ